MKAQKVRDLDETEVKNQLGAMEEQLFRLRFQMSMGQMDGFYAHDEEGRAKTGDVVRIIECRPLSKLKRWRLADVIRQAVQVAAQPSDLDVKV